MKSAEFGYRSSKMVRNGDSQEILRVEGHIPTTLGEKMLRRSPRLMKSVGLTSTEAAWINNSRKNPGTRSAGEKIESLRKSPRLLKSIEPVDRKEEAQLLTMSEREILRKLPSLIKSVKFGSRCSEMARNGDSRKILCAGGQISMALGDKMLRKSPRLMNSVELASTAADWTNVSQENPGTRSAGEKIENLRKSPRLLRSTEQVSSAPKMTSRISSRKSLRSKSADLEVEKQPLKKPKVLASKKKQSEVDGPCVFVGDPICMDEARKRWPWRYEELGERIKSGRNLSKEDDEDALVSSVKCHYSQANIVGSILNLGDCAYVKGEEGKPNYIGRILEFFETTEGELYFTVQWFYRARDTVMKEEAAFHDEKRVFYSDLKNDNPLECLVSKVKIVQIIPGVGLQARTESIPPCDFYYDMKYSIDYSTFSSMTVADSSGHGSDVSSSCIEIDRIVGSDVQRHLHCQPNKTEASLLDLYSGCGAMSTGLCLGAQFTGMNLAVRWAVDVNEPACESLKLNHPETQVRNETAEDFLDLLKAWEKLCRKHSVNSVSQQRKSSRQFSSMIDTKLNSLADKIPPGEYEVLKLVDICYGDPCETGKRGLRFKVRWAGYGPSEDTWELVETLSKCQDRMQDFVREGFKSKILPLPGDVDVICGGPPCQGISGYNRHRNVDAPLDDERNHQIVVFMDIVKFLKPKYVLMENVVDILKFAKGSLGRYALSQLVQMNYQARLGIIAAGCYGLPQFRLRVFLWGAHPYEKLPQYPLPTHDVVLRGCVPTEFERNIVAYDEDQPRKLENALLLTDAISELPAVTNNESREEMPYRKAPETDVQKLIRAAENELRGPTHGEQKTKRPVLYDHRPLQLNEDDHMRVCQIPKRKGANFRDLPGVIVGDDNTARWDPTMERVLLPSGKPLIHSNWQRCGCASLSSFGVCIWDGMAEA